MTTLNQDPVLDCVTSSLLHCFMLGIECKVLLFLGS